MYFVLIVITAIVLVNYRNVRKRSKQPALMRNTSKLRIIIAVITLQVVRLFYFSSGFVNTILVKKGKTSGTKCAIEWSANLPVALEYVNVFIIHEFLLRVYLVLTS